MSRLWCLLSLMTFFFCVHQIEANIETTHDHFKVEKRLFPTIPAIFSPGLPFQGYGVAVAQNDDFVFVAAPGTSTDLLGGALIGAVYVYKKDHGRWKNTQIIMRPEFVNSPIPIINITGALQVISQKNWLFISNLGSAFDLKGSVLIYRLNEKTELWELAQILDSETPGVGSLPAMNSKTGEVGAAFGVFFSADVEHKNLIVGAQGQQNTDANGNTLINSGAAYIFTFNDDTQLWEFKQKLTNPKKVTANDFFGANVAIHDDLALVSTGALPITQKPTNSSVYVFQHKNNKWKYIQRVRGTLTSKSATLESKTIEFPFPFPVDPSTVGNAFGATLAMNKAWVLISAPLENKSPSEILSGAVYFYRIDADAHAKKRLHFKQKFFSKSPSSHLVGAFHLAVHDHMALVPDPTRTGPTGNQFQGAIMTFRYNGKKWKRAKTLFDRRGQTNEFFGPGVSLSWKRAVGGSDTLLIPMLLNQLLGVPFPSTLSRGKAIIYERE